MGMGMATICSCGVFDLSKPSSRLYAHRFDTFILKKVLNFSSNGSFNGTSEEQFETPVLKTVLDIFLIVIVVFIMISMGCTITKEEIWKHIKTPISPIIGMVSQFVILPLCSYGIIYALDLTVNVAIGMLVLSCCPGGTMSNLFTYWTDGDVSLSITMTTFSTLLAFGMMPLNMLIYSSGWTSEDVVIPYLKICLTLLTILCPVFIGMLIKEFLPKFARIFCKFFSSQKDKDSKSVKAESSEDKVQMKQIHKTKDPEKGMIDVIKEIVKMIFIKYLKPTLKGHSNTLSVIELNIDLAAFVIIDSGDSKRDAAEYDVP
ncbi:Ileal sodium/bile acid cotransporter [Nymphon striatum]|nr:Ileal sodium/bile acid cotransporter [Nymphon striatum]